MPTPTFPTISTPNSANCSSNTPALQLLAMKPVSIRHCIVHIWCKDDKATPNYKTQPCTLLPTATPPIPPWSTDGMGCMSVHSRHHPNLNSTLIKSPQPHMIASICHTNNAHILAIQQNSPTDLASMTSPTINYNQWNANTATPQSPDISKRTPSSDKPSCNDAMHSLATPQIAMTNMQHNTMPYLCAHCYTNFCTMHNTHVLPWSIWHHCIWCYQLQFLPEGTLSNPNISTATHLHKT